jgi:hypothetical protein
VTARRSYVTVFARLFCHGDGCSAAFGEGVAFSSDIELRDLAPLLARVASLAWWMFVLGKAYCPRCANGLQASLLTGARGSWANAIKMGIVERAHLQRVEVESR